MTRQSRCTITAVVAVAALLVIPGFAAAQACSGSEASPQDQPAPRYLPYTFVAPGGVPNAGSTLHFGGGIEAITWKNLGAAVEFGWIGPMTGLDYGVALFSFDGTYHFAGAPQRHRLTPFVVGGYSVWFRSDYGQLLNFGVGANYWLSDRMALRLEFRDHMPLERGFRDSHLWGARVGFTWAR
ncbi:MAG TPA: hypothetical protein VK886_00665 [Vicinamibacterales bacterium]|nr:hypothetical protein [Vicinamibacterales bacterium]